MPDSPATQRDLDRLIQTTTDGFKSLWDAIGHLAHKDDVVKDLDALDKRKADAAIVERIEKSVQRLTWIGVLIIVGLFGTATALIANLVASGSHP